MNNFNLSDLLMDEIETTDEFEAAISAVWKLVDKNLPYPASTVVKAEARDEAMLEVGTMFTAEVIGFTRKMADLIEERTGIELSRTDVSLLSCAIFHQIMCDQISALFAVDLAEVANDNPVLATSLSNIMFKENL